MAVLLAPHVSKMAIKTCILTVAYQCLSKSVLFLELRLIPEHEGIHGVALRGPEGGDHEHQDTEPESHRNGHLGHRFEQRDAEDEVPSTQEKGLASRKLA